jgi:hypothetical protein
LYGIVYVYIYIYKTHWWNTAQSYSPWLGNNCCTLLYISEAKKGTQKMNYRSIIGCKLASKKTWEKSLPDIKVGTPAAFPGAKN